MPVYIIGETPLELIPDQKVPKEIVKASKIWHRIDCIKCETESFQKLPMIKAFTCKSAKGYICSSCRKKGRGEIEGAIKALNMRKYKKKMGIK